MPTILQTGFRPFFAGAACAGVLAPLMWVGVLSGWWRLPAALDPLAWHVHEMALGFFGAVFAGFLLTAAQSWTGRVTARGAGLGVLVGLWLAGRAHATFDLGFLGLAFDVAFFPALAFAVGRPLLAARSWRNAVFPVMLAGLGGADLALHLGADPRWIGRIVLDGEAWMLAVVSGRVIPMFTRNALGAAPTVRPWLETLAVGSWIGVVVWDLVGAPGLEMWLVFAAVTNLARWAGWRGEYTAHVPLLWVLHVGYAWTAVGIGLRALPVVQPSASTHALAIGGLATLSLGMMSRVALGHTGRPLQAPWPVVAGFAALSVAAVARIAWSHNPSQALLGVAAVAFSAPFAAWIVSYAQILVRPRADGKPG